MKIMINSMKPIQNISVLNNERDTKLKDQRSLEEQKHNERLKFEEMRRQEERRIKLLEEQNRLDNEEKVRIYKKLDSHKYILLILNTLCKI